MKKSNIAANMAACASVILATSTMGGAFFTLLPSAGEVDKRVMSHRAMAWPQIEQIMSENAKTFGAAGAVLGGVFGSAALAGSFYFLRSRKKPLDTLKM